MAEGEQRMKPVKVYYTPWCGFCTRARRLLDARAIPYEAIDVDGDTDTREWLCEATGQHTVPQIFIGEESIGGYSELSHLDSTGELAKKLGD